MSELSATGAFRSVRDGSNVRDVRQSLSQKVVEGLRDAIVHGRLKPGERIRQEEVANHYGTSRIPVRAALLQLKNEGLVTLVTNVGARVAELRLNDLNEIYEIRGQLEPLAMMDCAIRITRAEIEELKEHASAMEIAAEEKDLVGWLLIDRQFHLQSLEVSALKRVVGISEDMWNASQQYRRVYLKDQSHLTVAHLEHRLLIGALERHDSEIAGLICALHIRRTKLALDANWGSIDNPTILPA